MTPTDTIIALEKALERELALRPVTTPCIEWQGYISDQGYGRIFKGSRHVGAHVAAWEAANGKVPLGLVLDHLCRNRCCVNPEHLEPVTSAENTRRGDGPTARHARQTHCVHGHELAGTNLYITYRGRRQCRACVNRHCIKRLRKVNAAKRAARLSALDDNTKGAAE